MRINQVVLVPGVPRVGDHGHTFGHYSEKEAIYEYVESTLEHLEEDRVAASIHETGGLIMPNTLLVHCFLGWEKPNSKAKSNIATIGFQGTEALPLANMLCESLSEWGKSYVDYHHKTANPRPEDQSPEGNLPGTIGVFIRPFKLNGMQIDTYMRNADTLGRTIAYCVHEFILGRGEQVKLA